MTLQINVGECVIQIPIKVELVGPYDDLCYMLQNTGDSRNVVPLNIGGKDIVLCLNNLKKGLEEYFRRVLPSKE